MPKAEEEPWMPESPDQLPFLTTLASPNGTRHLAFDDEAGRWYRLWQFRDPELLHTSEAVFLRPSDVDVIIKVSSSWSAGHDGRPRAGELIDELAEGVKELVLHFAKAAGAA